MLIIMIVFMVCTFFREKSKEQEFIADFIARTPSTSGERLANWLQPESFVDPEKCEVGGKNMNF